MGQFDDETRLRRVADGEWTTTPSDRWNIGDNANGGYALSPVLRAMGEIGAHPDPLSVTTHFLRPLQPDGASAEISADVVRAGRTTSVVRGSLSYGGRDRSVFGENRDRPLAMTRSGPHPRRRQRDFGSSLGWVSWPAPCAATS